MSRPPESGWGWLLFGVLIAAVGLAALLLAAPPFLWAPALGVGGVMTLLGSVAVGVTIGTERANWRLRR